jgi:hypothetical protein
MPRRRHEADPDERARDDAAMRAIRRSVERNLREAIPPERTDERKKADGE